MNLTDHQQALAIFAIFGTFCVWLIWSCVRDEMRRDRDRTNDRRDTSSDAHHTEWSRQR